MPRRAVLIFSQAPQRNILQHLRDLVLSLPSDVLAPSDNDLSAGFVRSFCRINDMPVARFRLWTRMAQHVFRVSRYKIVSVHNQKTAAAHEAGTFHLPGHGRIRFRLASLRSEK